MPGESQSASRSRSPCGPTPSERHRPRLGYRPSSRPERPGSTGNPTSPGVPKPPRPSPTVERSLVAGTVRPHRAGVAQWQSPSLPSWSCGFDSRHPLQSSPQVSHVNYPDCLQVRAHRSHNDRTSRICYRCPAVRAMCAWAAASARSRSALARWCGKARPLTGQPVAAMATTSSGADDAGEVQATTPRHGSGRCFVATSAGGASGASGSRAWCNPTTRL